MSDPPSGREGHLYAVPLFLGDDPPDKLYAPGDVNYERGLFSFLRVISDEGGGGLLVEVFAACGALHKPVREIVTSRRLFPPVAISDLPLQQRRWVLVERDDNFDKEAVSRYSQIQLVLSPRFQPRLWSPAGGERRITGDEAAAYEPWRVWLPHQLERRLLQELEVQGIRCTDS